MIVHFCFVLQQQFNQMDTKALFVITQVLNRLFPSLGKKLKIELRGSREFHFYDIPLMGQGYFHRTVASTLSDNLRWPYLYKRNGSSTRIWLIYYTVYSPPHTQTHTYTYTHACTRTHGSVFNFFNVLTHNTPESY